MYVMCVVSTMYNSEYSIFISWQRIRIFICDIPLPGWRLSSMAGRVDVAQPYYLIIITDYYYPSRIGILQACWGPG